VGTWKEQWERVLRWYSRFEQINRGQHDAPSTDFYQDDVYAFFQNSYHLKDWLKNDASVASPGATPKSEMLRSVH
jgi:hypothetical protein